MINFLTASQCRAARGLLNWNQLELAEKCGMHIQTISAFEHETGTPTKSTLGKIQLAFENEGIEFSRDNGLRKREDLIIKYEDDDPHECFNKFFLDACKTVKDTNSEILCSGGDERRANNETIKLYGDAVNSGIKIRWLIEDGNTSVMGDLDNYRWMPNKIFVNTDVKIIYNDCTAYIMSWRNRAKVIVIKDKHIAEEARKHFNYVWDNSKPVSHSTSKIKY